MNLFSSDNISTAGQHVWNEAAAGMKTASGQKGGAPSTSTQLRGVEQ